MYLARLVLPSERRRTRPTGGVRGDAPLSASAGRRGEEGFSLVEIAIALGIFALVATFMGSVLAAGFRGVLSGKRRQVATQEANRVVEIARSLSYDAIGLIQSDPTIDTDPAIETHGGRKSYFAAGEWEPILWATNPAGHPFNPHVESLTRGSTQLTRYVYVTGVDTDADGQIDMKRISVRVSWDDTGAPGPVNEVRVQTLVNESGVIPPPTGGTMPLTAQALSSGGRLTIESALLGLSAPLDVQLPMSTGSSTFRTVSSTNCTTKSAALGVLNLLDLPGEGVSVTADDDARTATPAQPPPQTKNTVLGIPPGAVQNLLGPSIGSPISCEATALPLVSERGSASLLSAVNAQTNITALSGLLNWLFTVASVQTQPLAQQIEHEIVGAQREAAAQGSAGVGQVRVLRIPGVINDGVLRLDALSYGASVRAAQGTPSAPPATSAPSFTLRVFDNGSKLGSGCGNGIAGPGVTTSRSHPYCVITINPQAAGFQGVSIQLNNSFTRNILNLLGLLAGVVNLSYEATIDVLPPAASPVDGELGPNGERRWSAEYAPLSVSASLDATLVPVLGSGIPLIDSVVDLNLGTVRAQACAGATCS